MSVYMKHIDCVLKTHIVFVLDDLMVVKVEASDESTEKRSIGHQRVSPRDPFARQRYRDVSVLELSGHIARILMVKAPH